MPSGGANSTIQSIATVLQPAPEAVIASPPTVAETRPCGPSGYFPALTGLRFALAFWVILHHITNPGMMLQGWAESLPVPMLALLRGGYLAVQTFFVLSGFVLTQTYAHAVWNRKSLARFATARFARIYPVYFVSLVIVSPFVIEMLLSPGWTAWERTRMVSIYLLVLQGWTGSLSVGWNTPAWTLSCEFAFYLCFPVLFVMLRRARWKVVGVAMVVAILMPTAFDHMGVPWDWKPLYDLSDFIAGIAASRIFTMLAEKHRGFGRGYWLYLPALVLGGWLIVHPTVVEHSGTDLNAFLRPLNVALLLGMALGGGWLAQLLSGGAADFLGKASYSMYVLHVPILWWYGRYYVHGKLQPARLPAAAMYLVIVVIAAGAVFHWFEGPASTWIRAWQKQRESR